MSKKDYKRKRSKALTKNRKELHEPHIEHMTQAINHNSLNQKKLNRKD